MTSQRQLGLKIIFLQNTLPPLLIWNLKRTRENDWLQLLQRSSSPRLSPEPVHRDHLQLYNYCYYISIGSQCPPRPIPIIASQCQIGQLQISDGTVGWKHEPTSDRRASDPSWFQTWRSRVAFICICASDQKYQVDGNQWLLITVLTVATIRNRFGKIIHLAVELHAGQTRCRKVGQGGGGACPLVERIAHIQVSENVSENVNF